MRRKGEEDDYFCFECRFFGGQDKCHRFGKMLPRKGWECSCDHFRHWKEEEHGEH